MAGGDSPPATLNNNILRQDHPVLIYQLRTLDKSAGNKFVLVNIDSVINPNSIPLAFMLHYRKPGEKDFYLGSFALYPPDNPGRFIVPTQGKLSEEGEIVLTMVPLQDQNAATSVRVQVNDVILTDHLD
jgi:hypothetical protein